MWPEGVTSFYIKIGKLKIFPKFEDRGAIAVKYFTCWRRTLLHSAGMEGVEN